MNNIPIWPILATLLAAGVIAVGLYEGKTSQMNCPPPPKPAPQNVCSDPELIWALDGWKEMSVVCSGGKVVTYERAK